jgi:cytochrome P450
MGPGVATDSVRSADELLHDLLRTPQGRLDPYPLYRGLLASGRIHRSTEVHGWVVSRYADCQALLRDPRLVQGYAERLDRRRPVWRDRAAFADLARWMVNLDGADHTRLRRLAAGAFTPRTVAQLRARVEVIVDELLAAVGPGECELMSQVAFPLPVRVIGELLGMPQQDLAGFPRLAAMLTASLEPSPTEADLRAADEAAQHLDAYARDFVAGLRRRPRPGLLGDLAAVENDGERLTDRELASLASLLLFAGFETTAHLIGNGVLALLADRPQLAALRSRPELLRSLPDELLRFDGPVQLVTRLAADALPVGDVTVAQGEVVVLVIGAGNRDPGRYAEPDRLELTRTDVRPLGFGHGIHYCLGAALARLEVEVVFRALLGRFPSVEPAGPAVRRGGISLRGVESVPLELR